MNDIFIRAILESQNGNTQYILSKSLDTICVSDAKTALDYLNKGWNLKVKFQNGVGYESFKVISESDINIIKNFIENKLLGFEVSSANIIYLSFKEFYPYANCTSYGLNADVTLFSTIKNNEKNVSKTLSFADDKANQLRYVLYALNIKPDNDSIIKHLEKECNKNEL